MMEIYYILTFETTHSSISADKLLTERDMPHKLISVPQSISAGCGFCLRLPEHCYESAKAALIESGVNIAGSYRAEKIGLENTFERLAD